jgi:hypothetical protein
VDKRAAVVLGVIFDSSVPSASCSPLAVKGSGASTSRSVRRAHRHHRGEGKPSATRWATLLYQDVAGMKVIATNHHQGVWSCRGPSRGAVALLRKKRPARPCRRRKKQRRDSNPLRVGRLLLQFPAAKEEDLAGALERPAPMSASSSRHFATSRWPDAHVTEEHHAEERRTRTR